MKTLHYSITINAPRERVWELMLDPGHFKTWTAPFAEGSFFEGSWDKGAKIRFLTPDGSGLTSVIEENRSCEYLSIRHLGLVREGVDDIESPEVREWSPLFENYTLRETDGVTELLVDMDTTPEFEACIGDAWPKALAVLKGVCEDRAFRKAA